MCFFRRQRVLCMQRKGKFQIYFTALLVKLFLIFENCIITFDRALAAVEKFFLKTNKKTCSKWFAMLRVLYTSSNNDYSDWIISIAPCS